MTAVGFWNINARSCTRTKAKFRGTYWLGCRWIFGIAVQLPKRAVPVSVADLWPVRHELYRVVVVEFDTEKIRNVEYQVTFDSREQREDRQRGRVQMVGVWNYVAHLCQFNFWKKFQGAPQP